MADFEVFNPNSGLTLGVYPGGTDQDAILACVKDAGYASIEDMEASLETDCELMAQAVGASQ